MSVARLNARLRRLERRVPARADRCSDCPPVAFITEDADGNVIEGAYPEPCRTCGGPYGGVSCVLIPMSREQSQAEKGSERSV